MTTVENQIVSFHNPTPLSDFVGMFEESLVEMKSRVSEPEYYTAINLIGEGVFDFTTYESEVLKKLTLDALQVCWVISTKTNFDFIANDSGNLKYLTMVNMPFFANRLEWGTSIRGAWWDHGWQELETNELIFQEKQLQKLRFQPLAWEKFLHAASEFFTKHEAAASE